MKPLPQLPPYAQEMSGQFVRYLIVGLANTLLGLLCIFGSTYFLGLSAIQANVAGYLAGVSVSFILHRLWTFDHRGPALRSLPRFLLVFIFAYTCNLIVLLLAHRMVRLNVYVAQSLAVMTYVAVGFLGSRSFAFVGKRR